METAFSTSNAWLQITLVLMGGLVGFGINFFGGYSKEFFDNRSRIATHKRNVAKKILDICFYDVDKLSMIIPTLSQTIEFKKTCNHLSAIDKKMGNILSIYFNETSQGVILESLNNDLHHMRKELIDWANKIRVS
jgi:hypothetical protein